MRAVVASAATTTAARSSITIAAQKMNDDALCSFHFCVGCVYAERKPVARTTKRNAAAILTLVPNQQQS